MFFPRSMRKYLGRQSKLGPGWGFLTTALSGMFCTAPRGLTPGLCYCQEIPDLILNNFPFPPIGCRIVSAPSVPTVYQGSFSAPARPSLSDVLITGPPENTGSDGRHDRAPSGCAAGALGSSPLPLEGAGKGQG